MSQKTVPTLLLSISQLPLSPGFELYSFFKNLLERWKICRDIYHFVKANKNLSYVHLNSVSKHEWKVEKRSHEGEGWHLRGEVNQVVEYQVKSTSLNELL